VEWIAKTIQKNSSLQMMDISNNTIEFQGVYSITEAIISNCSLKYISLSSNNIGDEDAIKTNLRFFPSHTTSLVIKEPNRFIMHSRRIIHFG
jgi:Ran GTPase-activating protein (RanGAP) involved in mRNA processing and transport